MFLVLATADEDKPMLSCYISKELVADKKLNAGQVVRIREVHTRRWRPTFLCYCRRKNAGGIQEALNKQSSS
jgi:alanyl-tRNA synthetase